MVFLKNKGFNNYQNYYLLYKKLQNEGVFVKSGTKIWFLAKKPVATGKNGESPKYQ